MKKKIFFVSLLMISCSSSFSFANEESKLKLVVNQSINDFRNMGVLDKDKIYSLGSENREIWDLKSKKIISRTIKHDIPIDVGIPGVDSGVPSLTSIFDSCDVIYNLQTGGNMGCDFMGPEKNNLALNSSDVEEKYLPVKLKNNIEITRKIGNSIKLWDINSNKFLKTIWADQVFVNNEKYFIPFKNKLKIYDIHNSKLLNTITVNNKINSLFEYRDKLILDFSDKIMVWSYKKNKFIYIIKGNREPETKIIAYKDKLIANYIIKDYYKNNLYSNNKYFTKSFNLENGKLLYTINVSNEGDSFGAEDLFADNNKLITKMGPGKNWIDIWDLNTAKINNIIYFDDSSSFNLTTLNTDNGKIFVGTHDGNILIYNSQSGKLLKKIKIGNSEIKKIFIKDKKIISLDENNTIKVWDLVTNKNQSTFNNNEEISSLFSEKNNLASINKSGNIKVLNINTGKLLKSIDNWRTGNINLSGNIISFTGLQEKINLIDTNTNKSISEFKDYDEPIKSIAKNGNNIYSGTENGNIFVWNIKTGKIIEKIKIFNNESIDFLILNKNRLVCANSSGNIKIIDINNKKFINKINYKRNIDSLYYYQNKVFIEMPEYYQDNNDVNPKSPFISVININSGNIIDEFYDYSHSFSIFDKKVYYISKDNNLRIIDLNSNSSEHIALGKGKLYSDDIYLENSENEIVETDEHELINLKFIDDSIFPKILDFSTGKLINIKSKIYQDDDRTTSYIKSLILDGKFYNVESDINNNIFLIIRDLNTGDLINKYKIINNLKIDKTIFYKDKLIINSREKTLILDINKGNILKIIEKKPNSFININIFKNILLCQTDINIIDIFDLNSLKLLKTFKNKSNYIEKIFYCDDKKIIYQVNDYRINIFNFKTNELINIDTKDSTSFYADENYIIGLKTSPNNINSEFKIFNSETGKLINNFNLNGLYVNNFSLSHKKLIISTINRQIKIINLLTGKIEKELGFSEIISKDGSNRLVLQKEDKGIEIWDIDKIKLLSTYYSFPTASFVITPEGYYTGIGDYQNYLHFVKDEKVVPINNFKNFENPELVEKSLTGLPFGNFQKLEYSF